MKKEDRQIVAQIQRTTTPRTIGQAPRFTTSPREHQRNVDATIAEEVRTEGRCSNRPARSSPHETH